MMGSCLPKGYELTVSITSNLIMYDWPIMIIILPTMPTWNILVMLPTSLVTLHWYSPPSLMSASEMVSTGPRSGGCKATEELEGKDQEKVG